MISRNKVKVDAKLEAIKQRYPQIETKGIECDFSQLSSMAEYTELVSSSGLAGLDIGVLCLNAGLWRPGTIDLFEDQNLEALVTVNGLHVVYLLKALSKQLMERD